MKKIGYQLGTGVLIGFPGQTYEDLANDIMFYKEVECRYDRNGPVLYLIKRHQWERT